MTIAQVDVAGLASDALSILDGFWHKHLSLERREVFSCTLRNDVQRVPCPDRG